MPRGKRTGDSRHLADSMQIGRMCVDRTKTRRNGDSGNEEGAIQKAFQQFQLSNCLLNKSRCTTNARMQFRSRLSSTGGMSHVALTGP